PPDYPGPLRSPAGHTAGDPASYSRHFAELGCIFDAAAIGQFLGGIDPRNSAGSTVGFINERCGFHPTLLKPRMASDAHGRRRPVVETASGVHPVANLHVHSKNLAPFLSVLAQVRAMKKQLLVEGWRTSCHSYALVNQHQLLQLARDPRFELFHLDIPFFR